MVVAKELDDGFDLDKIDAEIKIEKIRQTASKLSWDGFQQALRRNLMEKRFVFDTEGRIDLLQAISTIRRNLPVDKNAELPVKFKQLSDSLECVLTSQLGTTLMKNVDISLEFAHDGEEVTSCKIGYFGKPPVQCDEAVELVRAGEFGKLRSKIFAVLATVPSNLTVSEKSFCVNALDSFEAFLLSANRGSDSFEAVSTLPYGFLLPRTPLRPARIYYTVEPSYIVTTRRVQLEMSDFDNLDYMELSVVSVDKEIQLPAGDARNPWSSVSICKASLQLHFSTPMLFSYGMWRRLERHLARPAAVKENVNLYRYMSGFKFEEPELVMRTCLPEPHLQHWYTVNTNSLLEEKDCVISEICIGNGADLGEIVSIVRAQAIHNSLWESLLAMSSGKWKKGSPHVDIRIVPSPARFELSLCADSKMYLIRIELTREFEWIGSVEDSNGEKVNADLDSMLTTRINTTRSIPVALVRILKELGCQGVVDGFEKSANAMEVDNETSVVSNMDKVGNAWLPMLNSRKQQKKLRRPSSPEFTYEVHSVPMATRGGLLVSYKEITCESSTRPAAVARAEARTQRVQSDTALAISDLEAICQLADSMDDDSKTSTPSLTARPSTSPAPRPPGCVGGNSGPGPGSGVPQLSPLETARLNMKHTVSAAAAVGLASASTDVFEFADDRSVGSGSAYPSPSPQYTPFAYGTVGSPLSGQSIRGATAKRRPRARKSANIGDRVGEMPSPTVKDPTLAGSLATRKPRGKTGVRRPRGSRRGALAMTHAELEMQQRIPPPLQRSYSDYEQMTGLVGTPTSPYVDTESDDECDPPPPPKSLTMFPSPAASQAAAASSAANSPSHSMSPLYTAASTPSATAAHPPPSPLAAASPSVSQPAPIPSPRASQQRKTSLDAVVGKLKTSTAPQSTPPAKRSVFNDLYDDGTESPPPPEERISSTSAATSTPFPTTTTTTTINASPVQPPVTITTPASTSSPRVSETVRDQSASNDSFQNTTPTVKIEGASKLILKIPKVPSRSSPSVETQKTKSIPMQPMPKLEKQEKKRDKEKKEGHKERNKDKSDEARRQKRKAEGKEKDREHKRHKSTASSSQFDAAANSSGGSASAKAAAGAPLPFGFVGSLKNFKIPKREEVKESPKEKEPAPAAPVQSVQSAPPAPVSAPNPPPLPPKPSIPRKSSVPIPPPPMIPMPRQPLLSTPPSGPASGPPMGVGPPRKPPPLPDHRDRRPSMIGAPPFRGSTSSIPLPKGPPPPQATPSSGGGTWIRPPSHIPTQNIRSPSPDPNAMQIDDDLNSPEDSLRIADD
ncbi:hypothetical protein Y032_0542g3213 [Ancylostoma ceylanicum]|uniref:Mediator complex subunit 1 n=1 Tax=Ancylostoma ceylanicum TaxID=53326 RepID=A0A016WR37_9BILA|nr:hypothetical protein Y032_0542g3213 [Ancylostoma ceylanicum]